MLPDGIVGWFRHRAMDQMRSLFGKPIPISTYPQIEVDETIRQEARLYGEPKESLVEPSSQRPGA